MSSMSLPLKALRSPATPARAVWALRGVSPGSARSILLTLLGEFIMPQGRPVWTSTLLQVLIGFGVAEKSARQAIARAAAAGWITSHREGRRVCWVLTSRGRQLIDDGAQRVLSMSQDSFRWDGRWLVLFVTLPESHRHVRLKLYRALSWAGFGNPTTGLWVSPHSERIDEARHIIGEMKLSRLTFSFVGPSLDFGATDRELVERSWNLEEVASSYQNLLDRFTRLRPQSGDSVLFTHVQLVNAWQRMPYIDPGLPDALLPSRWTGRRAAARLEELRNEWRDAAHRRWNELAEVLPSR